VDRDARGDTKRRGPTIVDQHIENRLVGEVRQEVRERAAHATDRSLLEGAAVDRYAEHCVTCSHTAIGG
jgi:hypothetical protein